MRLSLGGFDRVRQFVFASLLAGAVLAAPAAHARVETVAASVEGGWHDNGADETLASVALHRPAERNGLIGTPATFMPRDDRAMLDPAQAPVVDTRVVSPVRRNVLARAAKSEVATLPEPATWVMLLFGFGAMGAALRWKLRRSEARFNARIRRIEAGETA